MKKEQIIAKPERAKQPTPAANWKSTLATYAVACLLCCLVLTGALHLWDADLHNPLQPPSSDGLVFDSLVKGIIENGWYLHNPHLGAPGIQDMGDFPFSDGVHFVALKLLGWFTGSWGLAVNFYFLLGFPLATLSALAVMRQFGIRNGPSMIAALLFAFAPYHFLRGEDHLVFSAYYMIPPAVMVALWVMAGESLFVPVEGGHRFPGGRPSRKGWIAIGICAIVGGSGIYYALFTIVLLLAAGVYGLFRLRKVRRVISSIALALVIVLAIVFNLLPNILHIAAEGKNPVVAVRIPMETEMFGLRIVQMALPVSDHRVPALARLRGAYDLSDAGINSGTEGRAAALGLVGILGFCFLLLISIAGYPWRRRRGLVRCLAVLALAMVLLGTTGGFGAMVAWTVSPQIRSYARASIFIEFLCLMAVAVVLDECGRKATRVGWRSWIFGAALTAIAIAGLLDQIPTNMTAWRSAATALANDGSDFGRKAERLLPAGSMVLQLPYSWFPEPPPIQQMGYYDHLRPYLYSTSLRWSYGAMRGSYWSGWQADLDKHSPEDMLSAATAAGFAGIYIDRNGYADRGAGLEVLLRGAGLSRVESLDHRCWLYDIRPYASRIQAALPPDERARRDGLFPISMLWLSHWFGPESAPGRTWRWCGPGGRVVLENVSHENRVIDIQGELLPATSQPCRIHITGEGWAETYALNSPAPVPILHRLTLLPGTHTLTFTTDCPRLVSVDDTRPLTFGLQNLRIVFPDAPPVPPANPLFSLRALQLN